MSELKFKACDLRASAIVVQEHDFDRVTAERDGLQISLNTADQFIDELNAAISRRTHRVRELEALLTAADERADVAASLIQRYVANFDTEIECYEDIQPNDLEHDQVLTDMRGFLAALKPSEGGSDEYRKSCEVAHKALSLENQRITPARFKCLACGEYHEGSGNLPCPSMSPYSRIEP